MLLFLLKITKKATRLSGLFFGDRLKRKVNIASDLMPELLVYQFSIG